AEAYAGALCTPCSTCGAEVGQYCTTPDGRLRRCPCVARCRSIPIELRSSSRGADSDAAQGHSAPIAQQPFVDLDAYADPSEPRYPRSEQ
ncbi:hypothetical protein, partial [Mycobacterium sp. ST-F2]|uniref:hypothetical protein n=1 Tax=Mycobacterium sp. ST-F2 TaxID=1490484 RepID=UPI001C275DBB